MPKSKVVRKTLISAKTGFRLVRKPKRRVVTGKMGGFEWGIPITKKSCKMCKPKRPASLSKGDRLKYYERVAIVMAVSDAWVMARIPGCVPFTISEKQAN